MRSTKTPQTYSSSKTTSRSACPPILPHHMRLSSDTATHLQADISVLEEPGKKTSLQHRIPAGMRSSTRRSVPLHQSVAATGLEASLELQSVAGWSRRRRRRRRRSRRRRRGWGVTKFVKKAAKSAAKANSYSHFCAHVCTHVCTYVCTHFFHTGCERDGEGSS